MAVDGFTVYLATAVVVFSIIIVVTLINKFGTGKMDRCSIIRHYFQFMTGYMRVSISVVVFSCLFLKFVAFGLFPLLLFVSLFWGVLVFCVCVCVVVVCLFLGGVGVLCVCVCVLLLLFFFFFLGGGGGLLEFCSLLLFGFGVFFWRDDGTSSNTRLILCIYNDFELYKIKAPVILLGTRIIDTLIVGP